MAKLKIRTYPDPVLTQTARPVTDFGDDTQKLIDDMIETMYAEDGVGLAAPQVGVSLRILTASPRAKRGEEEAFVNPEIYEMKGQVCGAEGCLSFPGLQTQISRAKVIRVRYFDRFGNPKDEVFRDFHARVLQHETDHLNGILMIDRIEFNKRQDLLTHYPT